MLGFRGRGERQNCEMDKAQEWIAEVLMCTPESLPPEQTPLRDVEGWDSLRHVALILGLERELNKKLTAEQIESIITLGDVIAVFRQKVVDA